jgi:hypothetical protein
MAAPDDRKLNNAVALKDYLKCQITAKMRRKAVARNNEEAIPIHIRTFGIDLDRDARALMRGRITRKLRKFAASIERLSM